VLVRDVKKPRAMPVVPELLTADPQELLDDPTIQILVEVAGGDEPMHSYLERAIRSGKHVVTANKVVMAKHGPELLDLAAERNVDLYFEAAVGGGIPLISTFRTDLQANRIERVSAVINGTTNYVLGRMASAGLSLDDAVHEAQAAGFAEADPTDDIGGFDATYKLAILGSIAYEIKIRPDDVFREGIEGIEPVDFRYARELGYAIKLIAHTQRHPGRVEARVHPAMVPLDHPLAQVEGANNAVFVEGDLVDVHRRLVGLENAFALPLFERPARALVIGPRPCDMNDVERRKRPVPRKVRLGNDVVRRRDQRAQVADA